MSTATITNGGFPGVVPALPKDGSLVTTERTIPVTFADTSVEVHTVQVAKSTAVSGGVSDTLSVLFLHSGKFSSQTWVDLGTLNHVANWGYRAVAIDLPGKGKSSGPIDRAVYADFLTAVVEAMGLKRLVLVSPSSSGRYTLPYLFRAPESSTDRAVGFVPVAPGGTPEFREQYPNSKMPTLIVYGTNDPEGPTTLDDLKLLPNSDVIAMEGAGHPCYLEKPEVFKRALFQFLRKVSS